MFSLPRLLVAGVGVGVGKSVTLLALAAALRARGLVVAGFTLGPDDHDGPLIAAVTGRAVHPLDPWLMGPRALRRTFARGAEGADFALVEGALGLFDGLLPTSDGATTAEVARWLDLPVALVVDCENLGRTTADVAARFAATDPRLRLAGIVANRIPDREAAATLRRALDDAAGPPLAGWIEETPRLAYPSRPDGPGPQDCAWVAGPRRAELAAIAEEQLDVAALLAAAREAAPLSVAPRGLRAPGRARVAVAVDAAFDRTFEDDLARLEAAGAELVAFSPLADDALPEVDGLLLGDGPVESHSAQLARNAAGRAAVRAAIAAGLPTLALGGGALYLTRGLRAHSGAFHPLVGALDAEAEASPRATAAGYVEAELCCDTLVGPAGTRLRGHAWRHATIRWDAAAAEPLLRTHLGGAAAGHAGPTLLALPFRTHWASTPAAPESFVEACVRASTLA